MGERSRMRRGRKGRKGRRFPPCPKGFSSSVKVGFPGRRRLG